MKNLSKATHPNILNIFKFIILSLIVVALSSFFISKKENLDIDELYTYGLSNSAFQLEVEDYKNYNGQDLLLNYTSVKNGEEFNISNVFFNQKMDTHPPLYYLLVNFICSLNKNKFSMWYGLFINIIFLIIVFWEMQYIFSLIIKDNLFSSILSLISFCTYGFINEIVFTRMYVMLSAFSLSFIILIINFIKRKIHSSYFDNGISNGINHNNYSKDIVNNHNSIINNIKNNFLENKTCNKNTIKFLILFFLNCLIGLLTQYHFAFIAFFFSIILAIHLIKNKNWKLLIYTFIIGVLSIICSFLIFPAMYKHILGGDSLHSLTNNQTSFIGDKFYEIIATVYQAFFCNGIYIYISLFVILILINIVFYVLRSKNKLSQNISNLKTNNKIINKSNENQPQNNSNNPLQHTTCKNLSILELLKNNDIYCYILLSCIFYYIVISLTVQFTFARYLYNIYPLIIIAILSPIYLLAKNINKNLKYISILLIITLCITSRLDKKPTSLNIGDESFHNYLFENKNVQTILLYRSIDQFGNTNSMTGTSLWKLPYPIYLLRDMEHITFVDATYINDLRNSNSPSVCDKDDVFLVIYTTQDDQGLINEIISKNNVKRINKIYFTSYVHIYRLTQY